MDIWLKATKADHPVWESVVTMLSPRDSPVSNVQLHASDEEGKGDQKANQNKLIFLQFCWNSMYVCKYAFGIFDIVSCVA